MLRQQYKVNTSIPYHKTLKKAMTLAHEKVSKENPGKHVLITLDTSNRCLKALTKYPPGYSYKAGENNWICTATPILLPSEALNPKIRNISDEFSLPATPTLATPGNQGSPGKSHPSTLGGSSGSYHPSGNPESDGQPRMEDQMEVVPTTVNNNGVAAGSQPAL